MAPRRQINTAKGWVWREASRLCVAAAEIYGDLTDTFAGSGLARTGCSILGKTR